MKINNSLSFLSTMTCFVLFTQQIYAMDEDAISSYRVQTFSIPKTQGTEAAHNELDRQAKICPIMKNYAAYLVTEKDSHWIRGQLKCTSEEAANYLNKQLASKLTSGPMVVKPQNVTTGQKLLFESLTRHYWK